MNDDHRRFTVANVGDSHALLVSQEGFQWVTENHRLEDNAAERERVLSCGGALHKLPQRARVAAHRNRLRAWPGGVECARAIGDADCGDYICPAPAVQTVAYPEHGGALVVCTDGVWDYATAETVARKVRESQTAEGAANRVTRIVARKFDAHNLPDDVTCAVAFLGTPPWLGTAAGGGRLRRMLGRLSRSSSGTGSGSTWGSDTSLTSLSAQSAASLVSLNSGEVSPAAALGSDVSAGTTQGGSFKSTVSAPATPAAAAAAGDAPPDSISRLDDDGGDDGEKEDYEALEAGESASPLRRTSSAPHLGRLSERSERFSERLSACDDD